MQRGEGKHTSHVDGGEGSVAEARKAVEQNDAENDAEGSTDVSSTPCMRSLSFRAGFDSLAAIMNRRKFITTGRRAGGIATSFVWR